MAQGIGRRFAGTDRAVLCALAFLIFSSVFAGSAMAAPVFTCSIKTSADCSASGGIQVLHMQNITGGYSNAHAELPTGTAYDWGICCSSLLNFGISCDPSVGTEFLRLSSITNAHVQASSYSGPGTIYAHSACISSTEGRIYCSYRNGPCNNESETCLGSMASSGGDNLTNAHIAACGHYETSICCSMNRYIPEGFEANLGIRLTIPSQDHQVYIPGLGASNIGQAPEGAWYSPDSYYIASWKANDLYGLVHSYKDAVSIGLEKNPDNHTMVLVQNLSNSHAFVVFTEGNWQKIDTRMDLIEGGSFLEEISPTFGFGLGILYPIKVLAEYTSIDVKNDLILQTGEHPLDLVSNKTGIQKAISIIRGV